MSPNLRIAVRFLTAKKRAMLMSLLGIAFGVGFFIVTQAQTSGFEGFFIKTILGTNGAIQVEDKLQDTIRTMEAGGGGSGSTFQVTEKGAKKYIEGIEEPHLLIQGLRAFKNVAGVSEVLKGSVVIRSISRNETAQIYGIHLDDHLSVSDLAHQIVQGSLADFRNTPSGALVGSVLATRLQLSVGDSFIMEATGETRRYRVSAIYETGVSDIDKVRIYVHMSEARSILKKPTGASFIQISLFDKDRAPEDALRMEEVLHHSAMSWQEREKTWLEVFRALRYSSAITVSTIILISGLGMFNTLAMIVMEKTKEIAILRSMGYTRRDISHIFLWQGALVLIAGTVVGWILGAGVTYGVSKIPLQIRGIFSTDSFVVAWSIWHYFWASATAVVVVMAASLIPARRAAKLEPGDVIRGTAQ